MMAAAGDSLIICARVLLHNLPASVWTDKRRDAGPLRHRYHMHPACAADWLHRPLITMRLETALCDHPRRDAAARRPEWL